MIGFLSGNILKVQEKTILILTSGGVGYEVFPTGNVLALAGVGKPLEIFIHTIVREQEISLYGFSGLEEKALFEKLIGISGVGPKIALQILSQPIDSFQAAVERGDADFIAQTPGIGKKMAQKIIVELQGKLDLSSSGGNKGNPAQTEAEEALQNLGYDKAHIGLVLKEAPENSSTEDLVKYFLSHS